MATPAELERKVKSNILVMTVLGFIPDALLAFVVMKLTDDEWSTFWWVWIGLQVLYLLAWAKRAIWSSVVWRLWLRRRAGDEALGVLNVCRFPHPEPDEEDIEIYLTRIMEDEEQPVGVRIRAAEWRATVNANASRSLQIGMQIHQAWSDGLDAYRRA